MAYKISSDCVSCGACAGTCPVEAIKEGAAQYEIDAEKCVSCGSCSDVCPMSAIAEDK
ncbi:MAG: 4Fe-4S binding protein [Oscillospiraceae bacterium]|nr:4Fe-4S binding protein [Oscillospiraceae bacterium]